MTDATVDPGEAGDDPKPAKKSKLPLILGIVLALAGGGGGFFVVSSGMLGGSAEGGHDAPPPPDPLDPVAFVPLDPIVIGLPDGAGHLRFTAQLEVPPDMAGDVESIKPRIVDVLNDYLRAVDIAEFEDRTSLLRLRAQMMHRIRIVAGPGRVNDLLIMEMVVN
ncbi:flagellar basal body-associated protein FliL [Pelagovum pacificum]|uniref:Flagellar protein FliL n=1 Tax=Pelagovum pacificum TaxID=2588711 RepID=A0A5C5GKA6_9RHOB|nr:flagellar basal body-associated FliL family protein [Pelagovum pacificum]QQA42969.1 flagellar basal body-associated FliL family protein [Pelagovum pacificum]TNY33886.1 flagellar basal body-associated FliL family protein [Pelagovum pacificum]